MARFSLAVVRGRSMLPTLSDGDRLLVDKRRLVTVGSLVVCWLPTSPTDDTRVLAVKRVVHREIAGWWVERDNPAEGVDSWSVGGVAEADVLGVVVARLWPRPARRSRV